MLSWERCHITHHSDWIGNTIKSILNRCRVLIHIRCLWAFTTAYTCKFSTIFSFYSLGTHHPWCNRSTLLRLIGEVFKNLQLAIHDSKLPFIVLFGSSSVAMSNLLCILVFSSLILLILLLTIILLDWRSEGISFLNICRRLDLHVCVNLSQKVLPLHLTVSLGIICHLCDNMRWSRMVMSRLHWVLILYLDVRIIVARAVYRVLSLLICWKM